MLKSKPEILCSKGLIQHGKYPNDNCVCLYLCSVNVHNSKCNYKCNKNLFALQNHQVNKAKKRSLNESTEEGEIFDVLEKFNGSQYPLCIKTILRHAAYDSKNSCLLLDEKTIAEVEQYIVETGREIIENLTCCNSASYRNQKMFRFLPGNKSAILDIPNQIRNMESMNCKRRKPLAEFKLLMTSADLKELLLKSLKQSLVKIGMDSDLLKIEHLIDVQTIIKANEMTAKCNVQCFHCHMPLNVLYKNSWKTSNIVRHFKMHTLHAELNNNSETPNAQNGTCYIA